LGLPLGKALARLEDVHRHLRDTVPVEAEAGKDLGLREWRSCSDGDILKADTEPGGIAMVDTAEEGDTVKARTVREEDIGMRDPGQMEEDRKLPDTIKLSTTGERERNRERAEFQLNLTYRISGLILRVPRTTVILAVRIRTIVVIVGTRHCLSEMR
jgi:hypothetical protein